MAESWRVFMICTIQADRRAPLEALRELGHEPVALLAPRREEGRRSSSGSPRRARRRVSTCCSPGTSARSSGSCARTSPTCRSAGASPGRSRSPRSTFPVSARSTCTQRSSRATAARFHSPGRFVRATRVGHDLAPDGRRAGHGQHARADDDADRGRRRRHRRVRAEAPRRGREILPASSSALPPAIRATRSRRKARAGRATSRMTTTCASTGRSPPARSTTRCAPGT